MKKGVIFLLAIIYITLTSGIAVNIHYCMGRVAGVTYGQEAEHKCDKCGMEKKNGCCETEHKLIKADNDHIYTKTVSAPLSLTTALPIVFPDLNILITPSQEHFNSRYHSPPDVRSNNFAVYNSVFII